MGVIQEWVEQGVKQCRLNDKVPDGLPQGVCGTHARVFRMAEIKIFEENIKQCRLKARFQTAFHLRLGKTRACLGHAPYKQGSLALQKNNTVAPAQAGAQCKAKLCLFGALLEYWFYKVKPFMFLIRLPLPDKQLKRCFRLGTRLRGCDSDFCNLRPSEQLNSFRRPCIPLQKNTIRRSCAGRSLAQSKALLVWRIAEILVL